MKTFLGLSYERAYRRFYPAIDPLTSWSRYLDQISGWLTENLGDAWVKNVKRTGELLQAGDTIYQMMQVTGEEGISLEDYLVWQKATLVDMVYLQQDAFDDVDVSMSRERQQESFALLMDLIDRDYTFEGKEEARDFFTRLTGLYKNWNYSAPETAEFERYRKEIEELASQHSVSATHAGGEKTQDPSPEAE